MPWRRTRDAYRVWVSEVMLQQTQVATATPYYERFVARFPDVRVLARAPIERVLAAWAGLGYYRRARHLHAAARMVVREHGGTVPDEPAAFARLPGVGRYTLGAVLSITGGLPLPVLDGNVARVLSRWSARRLSLRAAADARVLWAMAEDQVPRRAPGDWNQALMELGATVCTPRAPRCDVCPVHRWCRAFALGTPEAYPAIAPRRAAVRVRRAIAWIERGGKVLMVQREGALLAGLWEPPGVELAARDDARRSLVAELRRLGVRARLTDSGLRVKHAITHRAITAEVWEGRWTPGVRVPTGGSCRWLAPAGTASAKSALASRIAARLRSGPGSWGRLGGNGRG